MCVNNGRGCFLQTRPHEGCPACLRHPGLPQDYWPPTPDDLEAAGARLGAQPLAQLLSEDAASAARTVAPGDSALEVVAAFAAHGSASHHLLVRDPSSCGEGGDPTIIDVVSQSDIVKFVAAHLGCARELAAASIATLGLAGRTLAGRSAGTQAHSLLSRVAGPAAPPPGVAAVHGHHGSGRGVGWRLTTVSEAATALDAFRWGSGQLRRA
jgi:hypothetical protein